MITVSTSYKLNEVPNLTGSVRRRRRSEPTQDNRHRRRGISRCLPPLRHRSSFILHPTEQAQEEAAAMDTAGCATTGISTSEPDLEERRGHAVQGRTGESEPKKTAPRTEYARRQGRGRIWEA